MPSQRWTELGVLVRRERHRRGLTQTELADMFHVSRRTVGSVENGEFNGRNPATLDFIELLLGWEVHGVSRFIETGAEPLTDMAQLARIRRAWPTLPAAERERVADWVERESHSR